MKRNNTAHALRLLEGDGEPAPAAPWSRGAPSPRPRRLALPDGGSIDVDGGAVELRDPAGRLLVRYVDGTAEIAVPAGDLVLSAPAGRVVLRSGLDVSIEATRDVVQHAGRAVELASGESRVKVEPRSVAVSSPEVVADARESRVTAGRITTVAEEIATTAKSFALTAERYELTAVKLVEKTRDAFREVADLAQSRIGRVRMLVTDLYTQRARRTVIASKDDTSVDGRKILLG